MKRLYSIGEDKLIKKFRRRYKKNRATVVGIGDDASVIKAIGAKFLVFTTDMLIEGIHFINKEADPYKIGWKAMACALSDIAAMAAVPKTALVSLGLPPDLSVGFADKLSKGIDACASRFSVDISGGDTVNSPSGIVISISVIGVSDKPVLRKGARVGDRIFITGSIGGSMEARQYNFIPRIKEAQKLASLASLHCMMDTTDGLSLDLYRLACVNKVGIRLFKDAIPISGTAGNLEDALSCGEDFELIFTVSKRSAGRLIKDWPDKEPPIAVIGEVISGKGRMELVYKDGKKKKLRPKGYEHFIFHKKP